MVGVLLAGGAAGAVDFEYTVSARMDGRARSSLAGDLAKAPDGGVAIATGEVELLPSGEAALGFGPTRVSLMYNPSILFREPQAGGPVVVLHRGRLGVGTHWEHGTFSLTEDGSYGEADVSPLRNPEAAAVASAAATQAGSILSAKIIPFARSSTTASLGLTFPGRVSLGFSAGYQVGGSLANDAGVADPLPFQYGPTGAASVRVGVTELDGVAVSAQVMQATFVYGAEQLLAQTVVSWERQVTRTFSTTLSGGPAFSRQRVCAIFTPPDGGAARRFCEQPTPPPANWDPTLVKLGWSSNVFPVASGGASWRTSVGQGAPIVFSALVRLAPFADYNTGLVYERIEGRLQADWAAARTVVLRAVGSGAYAVQMGGPGTQGGEQLYSGEAQVTWAPEQWFSMVASARVVWSAQPRLQNPGRLDWAGTVSVILHAHDTLAW